MSLELRPIGWMRSTIIRIDEAPNQAEGAPSAWLEFEPWVAKAWRDLEVGDEIILLTWLDRSDRQVMTTYPEDDRRQPLLGVFSTRSPDRPNPIGLHRAEILRREPTRILVSSIEVLDRTPVLDVKPVLDAVRER